MANKKRRRRRPSGSSINGYSYDYVRGSVGNSKWDLINYLNQYVDEYILKIKFTDEMNRLSKRFELRKEEALLSVLNQEGSHSLSSNQRLTDLSLKFVANTDIARAAADFLWDIYALPNNNNRAKFDQHVKNSICVIEKDLYKDAKARYFKAIGLNESVKRLKEQDAKERKEMTRLIGDTIPEHMSDLYPLARRIKRHFVLHVGPTNSGKTYEAIERLKKARKGVYLAPLRLLAYEIFDKLNSAEVLCDMITGEEEIRIPDSTHISSTIECLNIMEEYDIAVIDECQLIGDSHRGGAWSKAVLGLCAREIHLCSDSSCVELLKRIIDECDDTYEIKEHKRNTELKVDRERFVFPDNVKEKDALIVFSKAACIAVTAKLQSIGIKASMIYGNLPYDVRMNEVRRFTEGETDVVVATDAIGMGLNLPIKRIVFLETRKFDGENVRALNISEIKQIAGRAGRRGMYDVGYYTSEYNKSYIEQCMNADLPAVDYARINIPESAVYLDFPLSDILRRWMNTANDQIYKKQDIEEDLNICKRLETFVEDKRVLYGFMTLGFKSGRDFLTEILVQCAYIETAQVDILERIEDIINMHAVYYDELLRELSLEQLENLYLKYDLLYAYLRKFEHREHLEDIVKLKRDCSYRIIELMKTQNLSVKRCPVCGVELKWNYPYKRCRNCNPKYKEY